MANRFNQSFKTQAEYDALVAAGSLRPDHHYYIAVGDPAEHKYKVNIVNSNGIVFEQQDLVGLDTTALATYLTANNYITQGDLDDAIAALDLAALEAAIVTAQDAADAAQTTANQGVSDAATALTAANQGISDAAAALTAANNAQTTADQGVSDAAAAQIDADAAQSDATDALQQIAALAIAVRLGLRSILAPLGSVQTAIDAAVTAGEEGIYCATVIGTDDSTPETITVGGVTLELNTSCAVYFQIDETGSVSNVTLDNNSALARVIALEDRVTATEDDLNALRTALNNEKQYRVESDNALAQRAHTYVYEPQFAGDKTAVDIAYDVLGGLMDMQNANHSMPVALDFSVIVKGATFNVTAEGATAYVCNENDILKFSVEKVAGAWTCTASKYYPAPTDISAFVSSMPFEKTRFFGTSATESPEGLVATYAGYLGTAAEGTRKDICLTYRCSKSFMGVVTLLHEYDAVSNSYPLGDDSYVQFTVTYTNGDWIVDNTTVVVSESYNVYQEGGFN